MTSPHSTLETCAKALCFAPASFLIQFDYGAKVVWLGDLTTGYEPSNVALCARHAERFTVPVGWEFVDRSSAAPPLFVQESVAAPADVDADVDIAGVTGGSVVLRPDLRWELRDKSRRHPSVRGGAESGSAADTGGPVRDGIHIRRVRRDDDLPAAAAGPYDDDGVADDEHPSGPIDIHNRDELPHVAREIARIARELATESPDRFGPGSAFDPAPTAASAVQMPLLADDADDPADGPDEAFGESLPADEAFGESLPADEAFGESLPFEYDQTVVIDRYEVPGPMFLGDEDSHLRPSSGSLPF